MKLRPPRFLLYSLALFIGGCPKRQAPPRIVYIPAPPPPATQVSQTGTQSIAVEEPEPPEPPAPTPQPAAVAPPPPKPVRHRRVLRTEPATEDTEETTETTEPQATVPVPSLEPRESFTEEAALRRQIEGLQGDVRARIGKLKGAELSGPERKTLDDARTFLSQSTRALKEGDLQRALTLARKASLLVAAVER